MSYLDSKTEGTESQSESPKGREVERNVERHTKRVLSRKVK